MTPITLTKFVSLLPRDLPDGHIVRFAHRAPMPTEVIKLDSKGAPFWHQILVDRFVIRVICVHQLDGGARYELLQ